MNLTHRPLVQKPERIATGRDRAYLGKVAELPCCVCYHHGMAQMSPTQVHHTIHGRYGTRRTPDRMAVPLCEGHHQGLFDTSKIAIHGEPALWRELYGKDVDYIAWTQDRVSE